jgi:hypothetical protein
MLTKADRKLTANMLVWLDEEIELLAEGDDMDLAIKPVMKVSTNSASRKRSYILPKEYVFSLASYLIFGIVFLFVVVNHINSTAHLPDDFNVLYYGHLCVRFQIEEGRIPKGY